MAIKFRSSALLLGLLVIAITSQTNDQSSRGQAIRPMVVSLPKLSPAQAAYEDANYDFSVAKAPEHGRRTVLSSGGGSESLLEIFKQTAVEPVKQNPTWLANVNLGGRLPGFEKKPEVAPVVVALRGITLKHQELPATQTMPEVKTLVAQNSLRQSLVEEMQMQDWSQPTYVQRAEALVKKELAQKRDETVKSLPNGIFVAGNTLPSKPVEQRSTYSSTTEYNHNVSTDKTVRGRVRLVGGVALLGSNDRIVIYREVDGEIYERGVVSQNEGRFEITPRDLKGQLVAELHTGRKGVVGRGSFSLSQLNQGTNISVEISPIVTGAMLNVISARSFGQHVELVKNAHVEVAAEKARFNADSTGRWYSEEGFQNDSSYLAQIDSANHWGTILIGVAGEETRAKLFPNPMMEAFLQLTLGNDKTLARQSGVIWGVVTRNGQPLSGAKVEMAGNHRNQGIYFNQLMMPDRFLEQTNDNGAFAFAWVTPGIQVVRVSYQGQTYPAHVIPVEQGQVSYLDFEIGSADSVPLEIYDPYDQSKELNAIIRVVGNEDQPLDIQGSRRLPVARGNGMMMIEIDAGDMYELARVSVPRNSKTLRIPIVRRDWALSVAVRRRINLGAGVGMAIGLVDDSSFVVRVSEKTSGEKEEIIYFDRNGQPVYGDEGPQGGGFVIFNLSPGMRTISVVKNSSLKLKSSVIVSDPLYTNIILP